MKKKLMKEILSINKLLKSENKLKKKSSNELECLNNNIKKIEEKIKNSNAKIKIINLSVLDKIYTKSIKRNKEKIFIENNLSDYQKINQQKEIELDAKYKKLLEISKRKEQIISRKKEELEHIYKRARRISFTAEEQERIIIDPDISSVYNESKITNESEFINNLKEMIKKIKIQNKKILNDIESETKKYKSLYSKDASANNPEISIALINSSNKENNILQNLEIINNINANNIKNNNGNDIYKEEDDDSSISMELETNLNLDSLPSDDESLRFIDKVFDTKSNIKPIKNNLRSIISLNNSSGCSKAEKMKKVEPIKIEKPIDYKSKEDDIIKKIDIIKKEIEVKESDFEEMRNKKKKIEKENNKVKSHLKRELMKIKIIGEKIEYLKKQMSDFSSKKKNGKYYATFSINNMINNNNCVINNNKENNIIYDMETYRK